MINKPLADTMFSLARQSSKNSYINAITKEYDKVIVIINNAAKLGLFSCIVFIPNKLIRKRIIEDLTSEGFTITSVLFCLKISWKDYDNTKYSKKTL